MPVWPAVSERPYSNTSRVRLGSAETSPRKTTRTFSRLSSGSSSTKVWANRCMSRFTSAAGRFQFSVENA